MDTALGYINWLRRRAFVSDALRGGYALGSPDACYGFLSDLLTRSKTIDQCLGIFYREPSIAQADRPPRWMLLKNKLFIRKIK